MYNHCRACRAGLLLLGASDASSCKHKMSPWPPERIPRRSASYLRSSMSRCNYPKNSSIVVNCLNQYGTIHSIHTSTLSASEGAQKLLIIQPQPKTGPVPKPYVSAEDKLEEAEALVDAITGWEVLHKRVDGVRRISSEYYFGSGKVKELKQDVRNLRDVTAVFVNVPILSPSQHENLRAVFKRNVFDRFGIVLQIFKERAQTKEAKLQVELAAVPYTYARSPQEAAMGEDEEERITKEARKYRMTRRMKQLQEELHDIRSRRQHLREQRAKRSPFPIVAVVGYTNAGKTTLIKALSRDDSMVPKDMLFATLDSTHHVGKLPCGLPVLYVDTIGFVSNLPVELVESFSATLDDSLNADVLVHIIDGSHPLAYAQRVNVMDILNDLHAKPEIIDNIINVVNKIDKTEELDQREGDHLVSATRGTSLEALKMTIQEQVLRATDHKLWRLDLPASGPHLSWLHASDACLVEVRSTKHSAERLEVKVLLSTPTLHKFISKFSKDKITMTTLSHQDLIRR